MVPKPKKARSKKAADIIPKHYPEIFEGKTTDPAKVAEAFRRDGFAVVRVLTESQCLEQVERQVRNIWLKQPWKRHLRVFCHESGRELDIDVDRERYLKELMRPNLSDKELEHLKRVAPFHRGFGACSDPNSVHSQELWDLRQDPNIYNIARCILGRDDLWVDVNRSIQKLPTMGEDEFLHHDIPYLHMAWSEPDAIGGKCMFTDGEFICVPGTNTQEEHARIVQEYKPLYPNTKATNAKFALDKQKPDPRNLLGRRVAVQVPAGCWVLWSKWTMHGVRPNDRNASIQFGAYLGFMAANDRPVYKKRARISELEDRIRSFRNGQAPVLWPSLDRIYYYPKRYTNFLRFLQPYIDKTRPDWPGLTTRKIKSGARKGETVPDLVPVVDPDYQPARLTWLGRRLLGAEPW